MAIERIIGTLIGLALTIGELRVAFSRSEVHADTKWFLFRLNPAVVLKFDMMMAFLFLIVLCISNAGVLLVWRLLIIGVGLMPIIPAWLTMRKRTLCIYGSQMLFVDDGPRRRRYNIADVGAIQLYGDDPEWAPTFWLMDANLQPLVSVDNYAPLPAIVKILSTLGVKAIDVPDQARLDLDLMNRALPLLLSLLFLWLGLAVGPLHLGSVKFG